MAGALLWGDPLLRAGGTAGQERAELRDSRLQLFFALVIGATVFGSLWAVADEGDALAATFVTIGVAVSLLPI